MVAPYVGTNSANVTQDGFCNAIHERNTRNIRDTLLASRVPLSLLVPPRASAGQRGELAGHSPSAQWAAVSPNNYRIIEKSLAFYQKYY